MKTVTVNVIGAALFIAVFMVLVTGSPEDSKIQDSSAAIKDSGSSCHPQRVIEQSNKQIKDTYVKWGK